MTFRVLVRTHREYKSNTNRKDVNIKVSIVSAFIIIFRVLVKKYRQRKSDRRKRLTLHPFPSPVEQSAIQISLSPSSPFIRNDHWLPSSLDRTNGQVTLFRDVRYSPFLPILRSTAPLGFYSHISAPKLTNIFDQDFHWSFVPCQGYSFMACYVTLPLHRESGKHIIIWQGFRNRGAFPLFLIYSFICLFYLFIFPWWWCDASSVSWT